MQHVSNIEESIVSQLLKLKTRFENDLISYEEYSRLYEKVYQWVDHASKCS
ncbi:hypothetical protein [Peribacillus acanthi]|uniref:hypothetical protein n=1 Tax=Peribacillus acanthi TaxID=2171554 RepID=UPI00130031E0|nr:hypothetical protein [Peribacillus acanthi]